MYLPAYMKQQQGSPYSDVSPVTLSPACAEQLPPHSLQQALLLQPQLLDHFLEASAAAVLKPLLTIPQAAAAEEDFQLPGPQSRLSGPADVVNPQTSQPPAAVAAAAGSNSTGSRSGSGLAGGMQNMQSLLAASCPWMQGLISLLAHHPVLLLRVSLPHECDGLEVRIISGLTSTSQWLT
jgi:hypothetical protein